MDVWRTHFRDSPAFFGLHCSLMTHCQCQCERMLNKEGIAFAAGPHFVKEKTFIMIIFDDFLYTLMNIFDIDRLVIIIILVFISIEIYVEPLMVVIWARFAPMIKCLV